MDASLTPAGGNLIQHRHIAQAESRPRIAIGPKTNTSRAEIQLNKTGDVIQSIEIQCACGEKIVIRCEYA